MARDGSSFLIFFAGDSEGVDVLRFRLFSADIEFDAFIVFCEGVVVSAGSLLEVESASELEEDSEEDTFLGRRGLEALAGGTISHSSEDEDDSSSSTGGFSM